MTEHGFHDATSDPEEVKRLFRGPRSSANIGIATGPPSGIWVLDEDGQAGMVVIADLERQHGPLPRTVSSFTGREDGGRHRWFRYPDGLEIKSKSKIEVPGLGGVSVDQRGVGGYIIAPGSRHLSGRLYRWEHDPDSTPIVDAPDWLLDLVVEKVGGNGKAAAGSTGGLTFTVGSGPVEDLATAAGVEDGKRHDTAKRMIGSAIGRGLDPCEVARQAIAWAGRCSPPMDENEVLRLVGDLAQKQGTRTEAAVREEVEAAVLPELVEWPVLDPDALQGLAGEIVRVIEPETEADPVAVLIQILVMVGNLIGRGPYFVVEGTSHHTNLFAVLVGSTSRGRKGTSEGRVRQVLREVDEKWVGENVKTGLVSGEGLVWNVRDEIWGKNKKGEVILLDEGVEDKRLCVIEPEFASVLRACRRETNTLSPTIRSAWDSGILRTMAKNSPAKATDAHVSIITHITGEELRRALAEVDSFNGFSNRFLWVAVRRSKLLPDGGADLDLSPYAAKLALAVEQARSIERMVRDQGAAAFWRRAYVELADDTTSGLLGAVTSRAEAQVLRLSLVYALLDGSGTIREEHLAAALALWRYCRASARLIFGDASGDPLADRLLTLIRETPGISRSELHRRISSNTRPADFVATLARLRDAGSVRVERVETGGKPAEKWFSVVKTGVFIAISPEPTPKTDPLITINAIKTQAENEMERITI